MSAVAITVASAPIARIVVTAPATARIVLPPAAPVRIVIDTSAESETMGVAKITATDQSLISATVAADPTLVSNALLPNSLYDIEATLIWSEPDGNSGGFQCGLSVDDAGAAFYWFCPESNDGAAHISGDLVTFSGAIGLRSVIMRGMLLTGAAPCHVSVRRAQQTTNAGNPTTLKAASALGWTQVTKAS